MGVESCRIMGKCVGISKPGLMRLILTPASCPTGVCAHGKYDFWPGRVFAVDSLLCVYGLDV